MPSPLTVTRNDYNQNKKRSDIPTPPSVARFVADLFPEVRSVFDPCAGEGALLAPFKDRGCLVTYGDIKFNGWDFLKSESPIEADLVVCNPPFNLGTGKRLGSEVFLERIVQLGGKQIVLFVPMGFRLNQRKHSKRWRWLRDSMPPITSIVSLPLDIFDGVQFHSEILIFNAPHLRPHYFLRD